MPQLAAVTTLLHTEMPLTRAMGVNLTAWDGRTITLTAPLAPNQNHADTAFGGSISTLGIIAGYALLYIILLEREISTRIIIQKSATDFLRPIDSDLVATASPPSSQALDEFLDTLQRKRRARLTLDAQILSRNALAATHTGLYVAILY